MPVARPETTERKFEGRFVLFVWERFASNSGYYSNFAEVIRLSNTTSISVIRRLTQQFSCHGVPDIVVTGNGPQFSCQEFCEFAKEWQFHLTASSPGYLQSNGKAENAIKTVKKLFKRVYQSQSDLWLALLAFRNTPTETLQASLAQMLFGRCTKTSLSTNEQLRPHIPARIEQKQQTAKAKQATTYNRAARDLSELLPGQTVRIQLFESGEWKKTVVSKVLSNRSYKVTTKQGSSVYRRNRHHLRHSNETSPASTITSLASEDVELEQPLIVTTSSLQTSTPTRIQPTTVNSEVKGNVHG